MDIFRINEKCQVDSNVKRVKFGAYSYFGTGLESTHALLGSTCIKSQRKTKMDFGAEKIESTQTWNGSTYIENSSKLISSIASSSRLGEDRVDPYRKSQ